MAGFIYPMTVEVTEGHQKTERSVKYYEIASTCNNGKRDFFSVPAFPA